MEYLKKFFKIGAITFLGLGILGAFTAVGLYLYVAPRLPSIDSLKDTQFQVPLRIYSNDEKLIGEYGEKRRTPLDYDEVPKQLIQAVLGAEDDRFFEHPGVDYQGIVRAVALLVLTGQKVQGGSTITMQVARNFFLSREKTFLRKFSEILLSFKIEAELTKQEILELYLNKIYLGNRAYGVAAAAQVYYGKDIRQLNVAQLAMIAGLPKAPSRYNPIINPERALLRRNYVLGRMQELGYIEEPVYQFAVQEPVTAEMHGQTIEAEATYAAEMVRREMVERYGNEAYTQGYIVHTTIEADLQESANKALRKALLEFETRHGYRGPLFRAEDELDFSNIDEWEEKLSTMEENPMLQLGVVTELVEDGGKQGSAIVFTNDNQLIEICWNGLKWAAPYIDGNQVGFAPKKVSEILQKGDVIHFFIGDKNVYTLGQLPEVEGALVSVRSKDASIISIVGGYNFYRSKFNRAEQAERQPGSNFKPFVYSAALEKGFTAGTLINDAPVVFQDPGLEDTWRPENYSGKFFGPTRLREALVKSRNLVSIRILRSIGVRFAIEYVQKFGFNPDKLPKDLSLALGSASLTPLEIVRGYAVFSNGGYLVDPYIIKRIQSNDGELLFEANPRIVCEECLRQRAEERKELEAEAARLAEERAQQELLNINEDGSPVIVAEKTDQAQLDISQESLEITSLREQAGLSATDEESALFETSEELIEPEEPMINLAERTVDERNIYIMTTIMRDIVQHGTGRRAKILRRNDLAGKTGTTNDQRDAWFSGFNHEIATTAWVGFDKPHPLGDRESGARAALPMWIDFMREALRGVPQKNLVQPPGLVSIRIDPETGKLAGSDFDGAIFEIFREEFAPKEKVESGLPSGGGSDDGGGGAIQDIF